MAIAKYCALHMDWLQLASGHQERSVAVDRALRNVDGATTSLGEPQTDNDLVLCCALANSFHFTRVDNQRVLDELDIEDGVHWSAPGEVSKDLQWL